MDVEASIATAARIDTQEKILTDFHPLAASLVPASCAASCAGAGKIGGRSVEAFLLLHFQFGGQNRRRRCGNGHGARFRSAVAVENFCGVAGGDNFGKRSQRRAHDIDAAHQLIRPAVGENFVDDQWQNLKRLRLAAAR